MVETPNQRRKRLVAQKKRRDKQLASDLKKLQKLGLYEPKSDTLTPYRRKQVARIMRESKDKLDTRKYHFVKVPERSREKVLPLAKRLKMETTSKGIFYEREGERTAKLRKSKVHKGEYEIHLTGKIKRGPNRGKRIDTIIPIAPLDKIAVEEKRMRDMTRAFGKLKKNERLAFKVLDDEGRDGGFSRHIYSDIDMLIARLNDYQKSPAHKLAFFRHIVIQKTTYMQWKKTRVVPKRYKRRTR